MRTSGRRNPRILGLKLASERDANYWASAAGNAGELAVLLQLEPDDELGAERKDEKPIARAIRLVRLELERVESKNQLVNYLKALQVS